MANLMPSDIVKEVQSVLAFVAGASGSPPYVTAYQILGCLPVGIRDRLIRERRLGGAGSGVQYSAVSVVADAAGMVDGVEVAFIDARELTFRVGGQAIVPGYPVVGLYRQCARLPHA